MDAAMQRTGDRIYKAITSIYVCFVFRLPLFCLSLQKLA